MVRHNINQYLHTVLVGALNQSFKFSQPVGRVYRQIGVNAVIVFYRIRRTGAAFYHIGVVQADAISCVVIDYSVVRHPGIPDMAGTQCFNAGQGVIGKIIKLTNAVLFKGAPGFIGGIGIAK